MSTEAPLTDEEAFALLTDPRLRAYVLSINDEEEKVLEWLKAWQDWSLAMHHELGIMPPGVDLPDDTKGRRALADRLRAGDVAAEAVARLRAERNQLRYEASLLAETVHQLELRLDVPLNNDFKALVERHYKPGVIEPNGDTVPHPYRMTPELAAALSGLCVAEDPDPEHQAEYHTSTLPETFLRLHKAVERVTEALRDQQPEIG